MRFPLLISFLALGPLAAFAQGAAPQAKPEITTIGRAVFNRILPDEMRFVQDTMGKKQLQNLVAKSYQRLGADKTTDIVDAIKNLGFHYATISGTTIAVSDLTVPPERQDILASASGEIERAIEKIDNGTYGSCEVCNQAIGADRLKFLPYVTLCIKCQREMESYPGWENGRGGPDWEKVYDAGTPMEEEREVNLSEIEMDLSNH